MICIFEICLSDASAKRRFCKRLADTRGRRHATRRRFNGMRSRTGFAGRANPDDYPLSNRCDEIDTLLNSDYAGHRLTFQLFAQSPPFAHLGAVFRNFDFDSTLGYVKKAANLSDRVGQIQRRATAQARCVRGP
jgi:hypothetical protein